MFAEAGLLSDSERLPSNRMALGALASKHQLPLVSRSAPSIDWILGSYPGQSRPRVPSVTRICTSNDH